MSDFVHDGWSWFVFLSVIVSIIFCVVVLLVASKRVPMAADNTTGHAWDVDLMELNNPLPRWWAGLFVLTIVFAIGYVFLYPALGSRPGSLGWTSTGQYESEQARAREAMVPVFAKFQTMSAEQLAKDPVAMGIGERLYVNNCAGCHGSDARGNQGLGAPNLADIDWLHGGSFDQVQASIAKGWRGMMPPMAAAVGTAADVRNVANYVLSLSGSPHNSAAAQLGKPKFAVCAACHGAEGKGNQALGAPNLTDKIWLHGWGEDAIVRMVTNGKVNVMPAQSPRLSDDQIRVLAAYVMSLSQGVTTAAAK
jgi:cytochrome c oxidase cbb3-type subunit 3